MSFRTKYMLWALCASLVFQVCESGGSLIDPARIEDNRYYDAEIFPDELKNIYGVWELKAISGGFTGEGHSPNFDYIEIQEIGIFKVYKNDSLLAFGRINITGITEDGASIIFEHEQEEVQEIFHDREKLVDLRADTLNLFAPCCDLYNYHFIRSKKR